MLKSKIDKKKAVRTDKQRILEFGKNLLFAAIFALLIKTFLIETSRVPTGSMEETILIGDFLFVNKFIYGSSSPRNIPFTDIRLPYFQMPAFTDPDRGDIVVFEYPGDRDEFKPTVISNYVKRCIGVPGDTISIYNKVVFVNGKEADRPYNIQYRQPNTLPQKFVSRDIFPKGRQWNKDFYGPIVIPREGDVINLNPKNIEEWRTIINREFGKKVVFSDGKIVRINGEEVTSYTIKKDYYFMMGDNRDDSADSRFWGFVPRDKVVGEALMIYWSWNSDLPTSEFFKLIGSVRLGRIAKLVH